MLKNKCNDYVGSAAVMVAEMMSAAISREDCL